MAGPADISDFSSSLGQYYSDNTMPFMEGQDYNSGGQWWQDNLNSLFDEAGYGQFDFGDAPSDTEGGWVGGRAITPEQNQQNQDLLAKYKGTSIVGQNSGGGLNTSLMSSRGKSLSSVFNKYDQNDPLITKVLPLFFSAVGGAALGPYVSGAVGSAGGGTVAQAAAQGAVRGGLQSGISGAVNGQGGKGFLSGALTGGLTGGLSSYAGASGFNPAGSLGIDNPKVGSIFNNALFAGGKAAVTGGNPLKAAVSSGLTGGLNYLGKEYGSDLFSNGNNEEKQDMNYSSLFGDMGRSADPNSFGIQGGGFDDYGGSGLEQAMSNFSSGSNFDPTSFGEDYNYGELGGGSFEAPQQSGPSSTMKWIQSVMNGTAGGGNPSTSGGGLGDLAGTLFGLYNAQKQRKLLKQQIGSLGGMYGQDSPYAQVLQKTLARKDAASGRRSQYGPREVELQARLAEMNSRNAPALGQLYSAQGSNQGESLKYLLQLGQRTGLFKGLGGLFGG